MSIKTDFGVGFRDYAGLFGNLTCTINFIKPYSTLKQIFSAFTLFVRSPIERCCKRSSIKFASESLNSK